jgi:hypothetical protein
MFSPSVSLRDAFKVVEELIKGRDFHLSTTIIPTQVWAAHVTPFHAGHGEYVTGCPTAQMAICMLAIKLWNLEKKLKEEE